MRIPRDPSGRELANAPELRLETLKTLLKMVATHKGVSKEDILKTIEL